jgi:hypothetical protein
MRDETLDEQLEYLERTVELLKRGKVSNLVYVSTLEGMTVSSLSGGLAFVNTQNIGELRQTAERLMDSAMKILRLIAERATDDGGRKHAQL